MQLQFSDMKKIELIKELTGFPLLNLKKLSEIIGKNRNYAKLVAYRLKKEKLIFEIEKNKYTSQKDPLIIASHIIWPSYISCWTAIRYYNLTEQLPQTLFVITTREKKKRIINFYGTKIIFIRVAPKYFFGYEKERYADFDIFMADKEKALIDSSLLKKISFSEICEIIKRNKENINLNLLVSYLIKLKNKALIKRFGFLLETIGIDIYSRVKKLISYNYVPLEYSIKAKGRKIKKWRIIQNADI